MAIPKGHSKHFPGKGRPKGSSRYVKNMKVSYRMPFDLYYWLRAQPEPSTHLIVNALRKTYNLPDPVQNGVDSRQNT